MNDASASVSQTTPIEQSSDLVSLTVGVRMFGDLPGTGAQSFDIN